MNRRYEGALCKRGWKSQKISRKQSLNKKMAEAFHVKKSNGTNAKSHVLAGPGSTKVKHDPSMVCPCSPQVTNRARNMEGVITRSMTRLECSLSGTPPIWTYTTTRCPTQGGLLRIHSHASSFNHTKHRVKKNIN